MTDGRTTAGFVMADAIIALILVSSLMAGLLSVNAKTLGRLNQAETRVNAALIAQSVMEKAPVRNEAGKVSVDGVTYSWQCKSTHAPTSHQHKAILQYLEVTVSWSYRNRSPSITLNSARLRPIDAT